MNINRYTGIIGMAALLGLASCNKFLDRPPLSDVSPDYYLRSEADLAAYTVGAYNFPSHSGFNVGTYGNDNNTDNQANSTGSNIWVPGQYRVPQSGGSWNFSRIRNLNYFMEQVLPRWQAKSLQGNTDNISHYIGEAYFLRAYEYFSKLQAFGDFPIVRNSLRDDMESLRAASRRRPRNEVARYIIMNLDSAITLLKDAPPNGKNRISKTAAQLFKSRVALFEASWLTYHKGTAQVPGGPGWPGQGKVENFTINIDQEIDYFLTQAMTSAAIVADAVPLVTNTKDNGYNSSQNPYFTMFGDIDLNRYPEVLLWRRYDQNLNIVHNVNHYINQNGGNTGYTRGLVDNILMKNGLPIYAAGSGYAGDDSLSLVKKDRDNRLQLFMKIPGELRYTDRTTSTGGPIVEGYPEITGLQESRYVTGYAVKKGMSYVWSYSQGNQGVTGAIVFRAAEAYLNYIEASYLREKAINGKAAQYWKALRDRAGVDNDYMKTANATVMNEEARNDFGAYSTGQLLTDKVLYNIRRERRTELMAEGMRMMDLRRWRALDQLVTNKYIIEGFKLWGPMQQWYVDSKGVSRLIEADTPGKTANVSKSSESPYLRPYRINLSATNLFRDGYSWNPAHYLEPIAVQHFLITSPDGTPEKSVIYQNPGWSTQANTGPQ